MNFTVITDVKDPTSQNFILYQIPSQFEPTESGSHTLENVPDRGSDTIFLTLGLGVRDTIYSVPFSLIWVQVLRNINLVAPRKIYANLQTRFTWCDPNIYMVVG